jgi:hypothetical protein
MSDNPMHKAHEAPRCQVKANGEAMPRTRSARLSSLPNARCSRVVCPRVTEMAITGAALVRGKPSRRLASSSWSQH